jgi:SMI1 / KNR4 family (SUKH-1)
MINKVLTDKLNLLFGQEDDFVDYEGLSVTFQKKIGATQLEIVSLSSDKKFKIPKDYLYFLQKFDGCVLFRYQDLGGFEFLGTKDISKETDLQGQTYDEDWDNDITVFCRIICDGDFISFKNNNDGSYDILDCYHDDKPQNWKVISNSFDNFLERLIDEKGRRYWL